MNPKRISFRKILLADCESLVQIYNIITSKQRNIDEWHHQWIDNINQYSQYYTIIDNNTDTIVGGHGVLAYDLYSNNRTILIGKTENTIIDPRFRGKILYPALEKEISRNYANSYELLFTGMVPSKKSSWRKKIGYKHNLVWKVQKDLILSWRRKSAKYCISLNPTYSVQFSQAAKENTYRIKLNKSFLEWRFKYEKNIIYLKDQESKLTLILKVKSIFGVRVVNVLHFDCHSSVEWRGKITQIICECFGAGIFYIKTSFTNVDFSRKSPNYTLVLSRSYIVRNSVCKVKLNSDVSPNKIILSPLVYEGI